MKPWVAAVCAVTVATLLGVALSARATASPTTLYCVNGVTTTLPVDLHASSTTAGDGTIPFSEDNAAYVLRTSPSGLFYLGYDPRHDPTPGWYFVAWEGPVHLEPGYSMNYVGLNPCRKPRNTHPPELVGSGKVGNTLLCMSGSWNASPPLRFRYSWVRNGRTIRSATGSKRQLTPADAGTFVACRVRATNTEGSSDAGSRAVHVR